MGLREERHFTVEEFVHWNEDQATDYELVGGRARMMVGASPRHTDVMTNIVVVLSPQTRASGCRTTPSDIGVRTGHDQVRYPDVLVRCGTEGPDEYLARDPRIVVEILSPSTEYHDNTGKLLEYQSVPSIEVVLIVTPRRIAVDVHRRKADGSWSMVQLRKLNDVIELESVGARLSLGDIYDSIELDPPELRVVD